MYRGRSMRTLVVVNKKTHQIVATRSEDMNSGSGAKITKTLYKLLTDGYHFGYFAHRPDQIRVPAEINGRFYIKPTGWVPKVKAAPVAPVAPTTPKVRKFVHVRGFNDGTHYVEYDGKGFTAVKLDGARHPGICWYISEVEKWIKKGNMIMEVTP